ncbi:hypothetical protein J6590_060043 [Homalodisca vitripennis]|nr:hypothetical protein J6590_060043 [Homalodisca vitripennis]
MVRGERPINDWFWAHMLPCGPPSSRHHQPSLVTGYRHWRLTVKVYLYNLSLPFMLMYYWKQHDGKGRDRSMTGFGHICFLAALPTPITTSRH